MMTRLMTWFIELQNRFNESKLFKTLMIYVLNWVDNLTSWHSDIMFCKIEMSLFQLCCNHITVIMLEY